MSRGLADRVDARVAGAQRLVERQRAGVGLGTPDVAGVEVQILDIGGPSGRDEDVGGVQRDWLFGAPDHHADALVARLDRGDP